MKVWTTRDKDGELCIWLEKPTWCPKQSRWGGVNANGVYRTLEHAGLPEPPLPGGPEAIVEATLEYVNPREEAKPRVVMTDWGPDFGLFLLAVRPGGPIQLERIL